MKSQTTAQTTAERVAAYRARWHRIEAALDGDTMTRLNEIQARLGGTRADAIMYSIGRVALPKKR